MIEKNMLRDRASKIIEVTDEMWQEVCEHNRDIVQEYFDSNKHLSEQSVKQYTSALRIFFYYVAKHLKNKELYKITKRDFIKYFGWLQDNKASSSTLRFKKSAVSTLCNFVEDIIMEEEEEYSNFRNFTKAIRSIPKNTVYDKKVVTEEEYNILIKELEKQGNYMGMCYVALLFHSGARRNEIRQFKSSIADAVKDENKTYYETHKVRGKGKSADGKVIDFMFNDEAMKYIKLWIEKRGYEHEYLFTVKYKDEYKKVSENWGNNFCQRTLSKILNRRINPHLFKASCVTNLLDKGKDLVAVSKLVAHHEDTSTTISHYWIKDDSDAKNNIY